MQKPLHKVRIKDLERRRIQAGGMFTKGKTQSQDADSFGVSRAAACQWYAAWSANKESGLLSKGSSWATPRLTRTQKSILKKEILRGPAKAGYTTDFWTLQRIRALAKKKLRVSLGSTTVWRTAISLGFSVQKPEGRARERNEKAITDWKLKEFQKLKKMGL